MKLVLCSFIALALLFQSGALSAQQGLGGAGQAMPASILQCADVSAALTAVTNQDTRLRDWANVARYREANKTGRGNRMRSSWEIRLPTSGSRTDSAVSFRGRTTSIAASALKRLRKCSSGSVPTSSR